MDLADSRKWQFAGLLEGQGVRRLALADCDLLGVQFCDEVLVINASVIR